MAVPQQPDLPQRRTSQECISDNQTLTPDSPVGSSSSDRASRSSFSSIRETDSDLAQTFTSSKVSSSLEFDEDVVETPPLRGAMVETRLVPPLTRQDSRLHGYWSPAESFRGWKQINVRGKLASKSFGDLQVLKLAWNAAAAPKLPRPKGANPPGDSPFEQLPVEILSRFSLGRP